mmetsp:Transcript_14823/g.48553  ORF Transcript_14823/g.48553 Transcript_14823/m.48553 type:complete len:287 (-) Transcript_14823:1272-2132(-)
MSIAHVLTTPSAPPAVKRKRESFESATAATSPGCAMSPIALFGFPSRGIAAKPTTFSGVEYTTRPLVPLAPLSGRSAASGPPYVGPSTVELHASPPSAAAAAAGYVFTLYASSAVTKLPSARKASAVGTAPWQSVTPKILSPSDTEAVVVSYSTMRPSSPALHRRGAAASSLAPNARLVMAPMCETCLPTSSNLPPSPGTAAEARSATHEALATAMYLEHGEKTTLAIGSGANRNVWTSASVLGSRSLSTPPEHPSARTEPSGAYARLEPLSLSSGARSVTTVWRS